VGPAEWPAIVSEDVWRATVALLTDASRKTSPDTGYGRLWLGSGVYRCGVCGATMCSAGTAYRAKDGVRRRIVYRCSTRKHVARYATPVDELVTQFIVGYLSRPDSIALLLDDAAPDFAALESEARAVRQRLDGLARLFTDGSLDEISVKREAERLREKLAEIEVSQSHRSRGPLLRDLVTSDDVEATWQSLPLSRQQAVLAELVTITVRPQERQGARIFDPDLIDIVPKV
jgi:hypothetical protein